MNPFLSIITINLNNKEGLKKTIESVVNQSFNNYEYIIIDGGSVDGSIEIIENYKLNIRFWVSEPDKGIFEAMNKGIRQAKGEYLLFLNSGDWLVDDILTSTITKELKEDIIYFNSFLSYPNGNIEKLNYPAQLSLRYFIHATIGHQSTFISKKLFDRFGLYNEALKIHGDYDFWIKAIIIGGCSIKHMPIFFSYYDMNGISSNNNSWSMDEHELIQKKYFSESILNDYKYWADWTKKMEILTWYREKTVIYTILVFIYKVIRNLNKIFGIKRTIRV